MKRILITGHNGLLGSACMRHFSKRHEILTIDRRVDLRDSSHTRACLAVLQPDIVIHCAAKVGGVKANRDFPVEFLSDNILINTNVINASAEFGVTSLVNVGTSCMFPRDAALPVMEESLLTGKLEDSVESYAISKIASWRLAKAHWEQHGRHYITVNPSNIFGPGDNYSERAHVIPALIRRAWEAKSAGTNLVVWGDGSAVREFIYVDDVASAIGVALDKWNSPEVLNIGTGIGTSIRELVEIICSIAGISSSKIEWDITKPTGIPRKTFNVDKLRSMGWSFEEDLRTRLSETWNDFLMRKDLF